MFRIRIFFENFDKLCSKFSEKHTQALASVRMSVILSGSESTAVIKTFSRQCPLFALL